MAGLYDFAETAPVKEPERVPAADEKTREFYRDRQQEAEHILEAKKSIAAQISEGTPPEYVLYSALRLIGYLTRDEAWSERQRAKLDETYEDLSQLSLLADNEAIGRARLKDQKWKFSEKTLRSLNRTKKECDKLTEALNQAIQAAQRIAGNVDDAEPDQ